MNLQQQIGHGCSTISRHSGRAWLGVAVLAVSWLWGLGYYGPPSRSLWTAAVVFGTVLLGGSLVRLPGHRRRLAVAMVLLLPGVWFLPWPYKAAPGLIAVGLAMQLVPIPRRWPGPLGRTAVAAGTVLIAQSLAILVYAHQTARSHDLPWPLPGLIGLVAGGLGADVTVDGSSITMRAAQGVHRLGATWDLLLDPATVGFFVGGVVMLGLAAWGSLPPGRRWTQWRRSTAVLAGVLAAWVPVRVGLLVAFYLHRADRADPAIPLTVMNQFLGTWVHLLLLVGPVLLAVWFVRRPGADEEGTEKQPGPAQAGTIKAWRLPVAATLVGLAVAILLIAATWTPIGRRKAGRVMVVERHSLWEPTVRPYDEEGYGEEASYTYRVIYGYCTRYYTMSRLLESDAIDTETLDRCDVLVLKTPTSRFSPEEVEAIGRFVRRGGGLMMIGDHTNVFNSSTYLNDVARSFGFTFRNDLLFRVGTPYEQPYRGAWPPHPAVQHMGPMDFAVSCSIDPGRSHGRAVIQSTGLWSLPAVYHVPNYHPPSEYRPEMRCGAFVQLWATNHGKGRVLAFTDSTIFSNFCIFQPGKAELWLAMLEWLNHGSPWDDRAARLMVVVPIVLVAVVLLIAGVLWARGLGGAWIVLLAAGTFGWTAAGWTLATIDHHAMPPPAPDKPMTKVVIDRTLSDAWLSKGAFIQSDGEGFGLLEQWITRLGYFTARRSGPDVFTGDALIVLCPTQSVGSAYREGLVEYVAAGGRLLIVDSPDSAGSTANSLLWPFGMAVDHSAAKEGELVVSDSPTGIRVAACKITGGETLARLGPMPTAATIHYGKGCVTAIGFGAAFDDANLGYNWMQVPDEQMRKRYDFLYALLRAVIEDRPVTNP